MTTFLHYKQVIPAGFFSLVFEHEVNGQPDRWLSAWGFGGAGYVLDPADLDEIADAWNEHLVEGVMSTNTLFVRAVASDATGVVLEADRTDEGDVVGPFGPISNALIVEKRTGVSGRSMRGRAYMPVLLDADVNENGVVDVDLRDAILARFELFLDQVNLIDVAASLVLLHSKGWGTEADPDEPEPADPGNAPAPTPITGFTARSIMGTQRRRIR